MWRPTVRESLVSGSLRAVPRSTGRGPIAAMQRHADRGEQDLETADRRSAGKWWNDPGQSSASPSACEGRRARPDLMARTMSQQVFVARTASVGSCVGNHSGPSALRLCWIEHEILRLQLHQASVIYMTISSCSDEPNRANDSTGSSMAALQHRCQLGVAGAS